MEHQTNAVDKVKSWTFLIHKCRNCKDETNGISVLGDCVGK
jgi:hypothetical protein